MSGNPFDNLGSGSADEPLKSPTGRKRTGRTAPRRFSWWIAIVIALVGVAAGLFIWDQARTRYHKNRLQDIGQEWYLLSVKIELRERAIEDANPDIGHEIGPQPEPSRDAKPKSKPDMTVEQVREKRKRLMDDDPELKRLRKQIWDIEEERIRIRRDHPEWK